MTGYGEMTFTYDGRGMRRSKRKGNGTAIEYTYDSEGRLIKESNGLEYIYDESGIAGIIHNGTPYLYRKNAQGDIIGLIDNTGTVVVNYVYNAWGNHRIYGADGKEITDAAHIGSLNPIRYRGYYYDTETKLYFLKTRYYDPELCRFVTIDDTAYLDPNAINGLNLYAYCLNNPVMCIDPNGNVWYNPATWNWKAVGDFFTKTIPNAFHPAVTWVDNNIVKPVGNFFVDTWNTVKSWDWGKIGMHAGSIVLAVGGIALQFVPGGQLFGATLLGMGAASLIGGYFNESGGGSFLAGWGAGLVGGFLSIIPGIGPALGAFVSSVLTTVFDKGVLPNTEGWLMAVGNAALAGFFTYIGGLMFSWVPKESKMLIYKSIRNIVIEFLNSIFGTRKGVA